MATIKGKWFFNETVLVNVGLTQNVNFTSNGNSFTKMSIDSDNYILQYNSTYAYEMGDWFPDAYRTVDFGTTEQTVSDTFYTWLTANATPEAEPEPETPTNTVTIEYNGSVIASLTEGKATLPCKDKVMHTDIVVNVPELGGGDVPEWDGSYTITNAVSLISFTVAGTSYEAEDGMTWYEWANSDYNTAGAWCYREEANVTFPNASPSKMVQMNGVDVVGTDIIVADTAYTTRTMSGAD